MLLLYIIHNELAIPFEGVFVFIFVYCRGDVEIASTNVVWENSHFSSRSGSLPHLRDVWQFGGSKVEFLLSLTSKFLSNSTTTDELFWIDENRGSQKDGNQ